MALERWLGELEKQFGEWVLPGTAAVAHQWGRINALRPTSTVDGLLAATALVHNLTLVMIEGLEGGKRDDGVSGRPLQVETLP